MTGAGAIEVGSLRGVALAAGIINGMGAIGSVVQEFVMGNVLIDSGAGPVFAILLTSALFAGLLLSTVLWRNKTGKADL